LLALLLPLAILQSSGPLPSTRDQLLTLFGSYLESLRVQTGIPGIAAAIVGTTDIIWDRGFGRQDIGQNIATRPDTPFPFDGLTQVLTATMTLRCVEDGRLKLNVPLSTYGAEASDANATVAQVLTHTVATPTGLAFAYDSARLDVLKPLLKACYARPFRQGFKNFFLRRLAMNDSMPGPDAMLPTLPPAELATPDELRRYADVWPRLAVPYTVGPGGPIASHYAVTTIGGGSGLISTVRDFAKFDLALRQGLFVRPETLNTAWTAPIGANGRQLPHGMGWFVQSYKGESVVWQFGVETDASSSLVLTLPARGITLVLAANSDGLAKPATLAAGDVTVSPFARVFLGLIVR
jgi:CubicO group peptidase (beta-lactamase class C family)